MVTIESEVKWTAEEYETLENNPLKKQAKKKKKIVFVGARVHPGETPSSYVCQGNSFLSINYRTKRIPFTKQIRRNAVSFLLKTTKRKHFKNCSYFFWKIKVTAKLGYPNCYKYSMSVFPVARWYGLLWDFVKTFQEYCQSLWSWLLFNYGWFPSTSNPFPENVSHTVRFCNNMAEIYQISCEKNVFERRCFGVF